MANYAFIDWKDNMEILVEAPSIYYPVVCEGRSPEEIKRMEEENALPHGWENMSYEDFLIERRKLMAAKSKVRYPSTAMHWMLPEKVSANIFLTRIVPGNMKHWQARC